MFVDVLDIGSGNIRSIQNWIERMNVPTRIVSNPNDIRSKFIILPGVGSAGSYMQRLKKSNFDKAILDHVNNGNRILGICLGFQLMAEYSEEDGGVEGLGLIKGRVEKLENSPTHNGWEKFNLKKEELGERPFSSELKLTRKRIINGRVFYNHEYGFVLDEKCTYNKTISDKYSKYSSLIVKDNVIGIQFHPEKSQETGLDLISMII
ncbi:imidazole glycerol phosphate synthase subunit HisH [Aliarcobacter butzleri]